MLKLVVFLAISFSVAIASPLVGSRKVTERAQPASEEARNLAGTEFRLVASSTVGCANVIAHLEVSDIPSGERDVVEGLITFGNITINGAVCKPFSSEPIMRLYSRDSLGAVLPDESDLQLLDNLSGAVLVHGIDEARRQCGDWLDDELQAYVFTADLSRLLPSLSSLVDISVVNPPMVEAGRMWMLSAPASGSGRACLYEEIAKPAIEDVDPTPMPSGESELDEETEDPAQGDEEPSEPTIFGQANDDALAEEEMKSTEEKSCFPGTASILLDNGSVKTMAELKVGDRVQVGPNEFSKVFLFTHKLRHGEFAFLRFELDSGDVFTTTAGHYIYVNDALMEAKEAHVGDEVQLSDGSRAVIVTVGRVSARGLYNPQTIHGDIIVDNVRASTYTSAIEASAAHALLAPIRAIFTGFAVSIFDFRHGADGLYRLGHQSFSVQPSL